MKRSYHSDIFIQYKLGILPDNILKTIPSSTLHNWKKKDAKNLFGLESVNNYEENVELIKEFLSKKSLLNAAKAMYIIYKTYVSLFQSVKSGKNIMRQSKDIIIQAIDKTKSVIGHKRALKAFDINYQQYHAWKKSVECKLSKNILCRKNYYNQLTIKEVETIKTYLSNETYRRWNITNIYYQMLKDKADVNRYINND